MFKISSTSNRKPELHVRVCAASGGHAPVLEDSHLARLFANGTAENKAKVIAVAAAAAASEQSHPLLANAQVMHPGLWESTTLGFKRSDGVSVTSQHLSSARKGHSQVKT